MTESPKKAVVVEDCGILCGLGSLEETVTDLFDGASAIVAGPCFGVPAAYVPFKDVAWRGLEPAARDARPVHRRFEPRQRHDSVCFLRGKGRSGAVGSLLRVRHTAAVLFAPPLLAGRVRKKDPWSFCGAIGCDFQRMRIRRNRG